MTTHRSLSTITFNNFNRKEIITKFDGGRLSSEGGSLLLREADRILKLTERMAGCFTDLRHPSKVEHSVAQLLRQRIFALALGYEDLNDHDTLRADSQLALICGKDDVTGDTRVRARDVGTPLAGSSTLNRLELAGSGRNQGRYKKISADEQALDRLMVDVFLESQNDEPEEIWLDLDATDDLIHGQQEQRFYHGYYHNYCYLPLYIFCGDQILCARLRPSDIDAAQGSVEECARIVAQIRMRWPNTRIVLRADSGFCRDRLMDFCESNGLYYVFGMAKNARLLKRVQRQMRKSKNRCHHTGEASRRFVSFRYRTHKSWSRKRRVICKAEHLPVRYGTDGANPRFIVTNLPHSVSGSSQHCYEKLYCARGEMENVIKQQQLCLFADRTSTHWMRANQLRLYFSAFAYMLLDAI